MIHPQNGSIAIIGASRGLGACVAKCWVANQPATSLLLISRKIESLAALKDSFASLRAPPAKCSVTAADLSKEDGVFKTVEAIKEFKPSRIIYSAGGGPHGAFAEKAWSAHDWCWQVNFYAPARILHSFLNESFVQQMIFVGSRVAESNPDPGAASYAAAKHALMGLVTSVQEENPNFDLRLFSPGYMSTDLLPPGSWPRSVGLARDPMEQAQRLIDWMQQPVVCKHLKA